MIPHSSTNGENLRDRGPANFPYSIAGLESQAIALRAMPDSEVKLGNIHALGVHCRATSLELESAFNRLFGDDLERLKVFWGLRNGRELLADKISKEGGLQ